MSAGVGGGGAVEAGQRPAEPPPPPPAPRPCTDPAVSSLAPGGAPSGAAAAAALAPPQPRSSSDWKARGTAPPGRRSAEASPLPGAAPPGELGEEERLVRAALLGFPSAPCPCAAPPAPALRPLPLPPAPPAAAWPAAATAAACAASRCALRRCLAALIPHALQSSWSPTRRHCGQGTGPGKGERPPGGSRGRARSGMQARYRRKPVLGQGGGAQKQRLGHSMPHTRHVPVGSRCSRRRCSSSAPAAARGRGRGGAGAGLGRAPGCSGSLSTPLSEGRRRPASRSTAAGQSPSPSAVQAGTRHPALPAPLPHPTKRTAQARPQTPGRQQPWRGGTWRRGSATLTPTPRLSQAYSRHAGH